MHSPVSLAEIGGAGVSGDRWGHEVRERKAQASSTVSACQEGGWGGGDDGDGGGGAGAKRQSWGCLCSLG